LSLNVIQNSGLTGLTFCCFGSDNWATDIVHDTAYAVAAVCSLTCSHIVPASMNMFPNCLLDYYAVITLFESDNDLEMELF